MRFLDLFAGIGGFRLGMEMAGHECVGWCEKDKYARKSYIAMHNPKEDEWFAEDIQKVKPKEMPTADVWCFGSPCQDISIAGKQSGLSGERSGLFYTVANLLKRQKEKNKPSYLFFENVKNLLSVNGGWDFARVLFELDEAGYDAEWQVLNSKDFGVPQNRERIFIIGHFRGRSTGKVFPVCRKSEKILKQLIGGSQGMRVYDPNGISCTLSAEGGGWGAKTGLYCVENQKNNGEVLKSIPIGFNRKAGILNEIKIAHTISASDWRGLNRNQTQNAVLEVKTVVSDKKYRIRRLTPKECFRLQGFPDELFEKARAINSDTQLYKRIGNSVTVPIVYEIAKRFVEGDDTCKKAVH
jgi:DNA (cytosine-5)-methyltransferase 1